MQDLFVPNNLVLQKDGSVKPKDFAKEIVPEKDESFIHFYNRMDKELAHLKSYERGILHIVSAHDLSLVSSSSVIHGQSIKTQWYLS